MHLLSSDDVKQAKVETARETAERIQTLNREESILVRKLNLAKMEWEEHKNADEKATTQYVQEMQARKNSIRLEVESLEAQRRELMQPIHEVMENAKKMLNEAEKQAILVEQQKFHVKQREEEVLETLENLHDQSDELKQCAAELDKRDQAQQDEKERFKLLQEKLAQDWVEYHKAVHKNNEELVEREKSVTTRETAVAIRAQELEKQAQEQSDKEMQLIDRYATLERTQRELTTGKRL